MGLSNPLLDSAEVAKRDNLVKLSTDVAEIASVEDLARRKEETGL